MTLSRIPLIATPSQRLTVSLSDRPCQIALVQRSTGLFFDLLVNDAPVARGVLCLNKTPLVRRSYGDFTGDFCFVDQLGDADPFYTGLADRFALVYRES